MLKTLFFKKLHKKNFKNHRKSKPAYISNFHIFIKKLFLGMNREAVQHERGPRSSTLKKMALLNSIQSSFSTASNTIASSPPSANSSRKSTALLNKNQELFSKLASMHHAAASALSPTMVPTTSSLFGPPPPIQFMNGFLGKGLVSLFLRVEIMCLMLFY